MRRDAKMKADAVAIGEEARLEAERAAARKGAAQPK